MIRGALLFCCLALGCVCPSFAAVRRNLPKCTVHPLNVPAEIREELSRYSLSAYENDDATNKVKALFFVPKTKSPAPFPMVVYIPGRGELDDVAEHLRQRVMINRVIRSGLQEKYPCFLLAVTPPGEATTLMGGMPGHPTGMQCAIRDFVFEIARMQKKPRVDLNRLYLTGFSYGGSGSYAIAQHFPGMFAAVVPVAAVPPLPEYFVKEKPGNWWHFHNEGDYSRHGIDTRQIEEFAKLVNDAGGDFRISTYPDADHDAWSKAWAEDVVWDWMFSKSLNGSVKPMTKVAKRSDPVPMPLSSAMCSASVPGMDAGHGPDRVADGLDATWYESKTPFGSGDWWQVEFKDPISGKFALVSGDGHGERTIRDAFVECSTDGKRWMKIASFANKDGSCSFASRKPIRYLRVRSRSPKPQTICLRRLKVFKDRK